jgi:predicted DNA-binding transcriptional regulator YafY
MILFKQIRLLEHIHKLISQSCTGVPKSFAGKLGISERYLHTILDELKDMGAPIRYSRKEETYYYSECFEINISVRLDASQLRNKKTLLPEK